MSRRPPYVESIDPDPVAPGETVSIIGRDFGVEGRIEVDEIAVNPEAVRSWQDNLIVFLMPEHLRSGLLRVQTDNGISNSHFLTNRADVPRRGEGGRTRIGSVRPQIVHAGTVVTVLGDGFGPRTALTEFGFDLIEREARLEYAGTVWWLTEWSNRRLQFVMPPDVPPGPVDLVVNGTVLAVDLIVAERPGQVIWGEATPVDLQQRVQLRETTVPDGETRDQRVRRYGERIAEVRVLLPRVPGQSGPGSQTEAELVTEFGNLTRQGGGNAWTYIPSPEPARMAEAESESEQIPIDEQPVVFAAERHERILRRSVRWEIEGSGAVAQLQEPDFRRGFRRFLQPDDGVPVDAVRLQTLRRQSVDLRNTPEAIARRIHVVVQENLSPDIHGTEDLETALDGEPAGATVYADMMAALLRISGIPARRHFGVILDDRGEPYDHAWVEFFLPRLGWIPADPALGDGMYDDRFSRALQFYGETPAAATFGALDDRRVAFFVDGTGDPLVYPFGTRIVADRVYGGPLLRLEAPDEHTLDGLVISWQIRTPPGTSSASESGLN